MHVGSLHKSEKSYDTKPWHWWKSIREKLDEPVMYWLTVQAWRWNVLAYLDRFGLLSNDKNDIENIDNCLNIIKNPNWIIYTNALATSALEFYKVCKGDLDDIFKVKRTRVGYEIIDFVNHNLVSEINTSIDVEVSGKLMSKSENNAQWLFDGLSNALRNILVWEDFTYLKDIELVDYDPRNLVTGTSAVVVTYITLRDKNTWDSWSVATVWENQIQSAFEAIQDWFRYWIYVQQWKIKHFQSPNLIY